MYKLQIPRYCVGRTGNFDYKTRFSLSGHTEDFNGKKHLKAKYAQKYG
jgi:hypothetical protein